jgi:hypothetical protein
MKLKLSTLSESMSRSESVNDPNDIPPKRLARSLLAAGLMLLVDEVSSPLDLIDDDDLEESEPNASGSERIGAAKRCDPSLPTQKQKLPNFIFIGSSR